MNYVVVVSTYEGKFPPDVDIVGPFRSEETANKYARSKHSPNVTAKTHPLYRVSR